MPTHVLVHFLCLSQSGVLGSSGDVVLGITSGPGPHGTWYIGKPSGVCMGFKGTGSVGSGSGRRGAGRDGEVGLVVGLGRGPVPGVTPGRVFGVAVRPGTTPLPSSVPVGRMLGPVGIR